MLWDTTLETATHRTLLIYISLSDPVGIDLRWMSGPLVTKQIGLPNIACAPNGDVLKVEGDADGNTYTITLSKVTQIRIPVAVSPNLIAGS
jgi:hypothetical protein